MVKVLDLTEVKFGPGIDEYSNTYFKVKKFPDGLSTFRLKQQGLVIYNASSVLINTRFKSEFDIILLFQTLEVLTQANIKNIAVNIFYFPYSRLDKVVREKDGTLGTIDLKWITRILNSYSLDKVNIFMPYSDVTGALLDKVNVLNPFYFIESVVKDIYNSNEEEIKSPIAFLVDSYRVMNWLKPIANELELEVVLTSELFNKDFSNYDLVFVTDIGDSLNNINKTLIEDLKKQNINRLFFACGHGIFSKGTEEFTLNGRFAKVYTTNSFSDFEENTIDKKSDLIKVFDLKTLV